MSPFDFLICDKNYLNPLCAIELNDKSHNSKKRKERDDFLIQSCASANFPLIQITAKATYTLKDVKVALSEFIPKDSVTEESKQSTIGSSEESEKACPKCSAKMVIKVAKKGKNIGNEFWACSAFPKCRHVEIKSA